MIFGTNRQKNTYKQILLKNAHKKFSKIKLTNFFKKAGYGIIVNFILKYKIYNKLKKIYNFSWNIFSKMSCL